MESTNQYPMGVNRFECRACPYEYVVGKEYYERTEVKQKEVEDVFGGKEEFANADSVASKLTSYCLLCRIVPPCLFDWTSTDDFSPQHNALQRTAMANGRTSSSCRFAVPTSR